MQFSLKFLMTVVLIAGVIAGGIGWHIRNRPKPVSIRYDVVKGSTARSNYSYPKELIVRRKPWTYRHLRRLAISELPPTDDELLQQIVADPTVYCFYKDRHVELIKQNRKTVLAATEKFLDPKNSASILFSTAVTYKDLDERRGFDLLRKQFLEDHNSGFANQLWGFPKQWWENDEAIKSGLLAGLNDPTAKDKESFMYGLKRFGNNQPLVEHLFETAQKTGAKDYEIEELAREEPSLRALQIAREFVETKTEVVEYQRANLIEFFCQSDDAEVKSRALAICERLSHYETDVNNQKSEYAHHDDEGYNFYEKVCTHGGAEYSQYFQRYAKEKRSDNAMRALVRIWPRDKAADFAKEHHYEKIVTELLGEQAMPYLLKRMDEQPNAALPRLIVQAAGGKPHAAAADAIETFLMELEDDGVNYYLGRELIYLMKKLGRDDADSLISVIPAAPLPQWEEQFWIQKNIDQQQFVSFLNSEKVGNPISLDDVLQQFEDKGYPTENYRNNDLLAGNGYEVRWYMFQALEAAGVARECCVLDRYFSYAPQLVDLVNQWSLGTAANKQNLAQDHRLWAAPSYKETKLNFTFEKRVFEVPNIAEDQTHPVFAAEALNTILAEFSDYTKRFYVYIYHTGGYNEHYIVYLEPDIAKKLEEDFGLVPFP